VIPGQLKFVFRPNGSMSSVWFIVNNGQWSWHGGTEMKHIDSDAVA